MLQFLTLAWNTEEKAFGFPGEPKEGSPDLSASSQPQHGAVFLPRAVRAWSWSWSLLRSKTCVHSSCRQGPTLSLQGQGDRMLTLMGYGPQKS